MSSLCCKMYMMVSCICSCCYKQSFEYAECMNMEWRKLSYHSVSVIAQQRISDLVCCKCTKSYWPEGFPANCEFRLVCGWYIEPIWRCRMCCRTCLYAARHTLRQKGFSCSNCNKCVKFMLPSHGNNEVLLKQRISILVRENLCAVVSGVTQWITAVSSQAAWFYHSWTLCIRGL